MRYISLLILLFIVLFGCAQQDNKGNLVTYKMDTLSYEGYYISGGKDAPLVLLAHDWDGLTDYEIKRSNMLAKLGFSVFAADLFGKGIRPSDLENRRKHTTELYNNREKMRKLMYTALEVAKTKGANINNAVAMGYCFGGAVVLELARDAASDLKGFASFHGGLKTPSGQDYSKTKGDILIMHGAADKLIPMYNFSELANELEYSGVPNEMITYGGARHAFTVFGGDRYNKSADRKSWKRFIDFLNSKLKK